MLEISPSGKFKCSLPGLSGPETYDLSLIICNNPDCPCRDVQVEIVRASEGKPLKFIADIDKRIVETAGNGDPLIAAFQSSMTESDWVKLTDRFWQHKADHAEDYDFEWQRTEPIRVGPKIGRNEPCPCGSSKKYKKCCLGRGPSSTTD